MITPTQAQIEAAANVILQWAIVPMELARAKECAKAALTAAAEAGPTELEALEEHQAPSRDYMRGYVDGGNETKSATIERCAQVADSFAQEGFGHAVSIAAAIRALKVK